MAVKIQGKGKGMFRRFRFALLLIPGLLSLFAAFAVLPASAAPALPPGGCTSLGTNPALTGYQIPVKGGLLLDALNWGGGGSRAAACTGAQINAQVGVWKASGAGIAADFTRIPVTGLAAPDQAKCVANGATGCGLIEYTPGNLQSGLCVSTVIDRQGAFALLRGCASSLQDGTAGHAMNQWQDFAFVPTGDGFFEITAVLEPAPGPFVLNDRAWGFSGSPIISWPPISSILTPCATSHGCENQIFENATAP